MGSSARAVTCSSFSAIVVWDAVVGAVFDRAGERRERIEGQRARASQLRQQQMRQQKMQQQNVRGCAGGGRDADGSRQQATGRSPAAVSVEVPEATGSWEAVAGEAAANEAAESEIADLRQ